MRSLVEGSGALGLKRKYKLKFKGGEIDPKTKSRMALSEPKSLLDRSWL